MFNWPVKPGGRRLRRLPHQLNNSHKVAAKERVLSTAQKVTSINASASPSVDDVTNWLRQKSERGEIGTNSARLRITSVNQLASILSDDEPHTAQYVLENISPITRRWATLNGAAKGGTARTYESRAKGSIEDYFRWLADPVGFEFSRRDPTDNPSTWTSYVHYSMK
jgi:hypothetical protein